MLSETEHPRLVTGLEKICQIIVDGGGYIDPNIQFDYQDDAFSIWKTGQIDKGYFIRLPHDLLIPYHDFDLDIEDQQIVIVSHKESVTKAQLALFENILALYNDSHIFSKHYRDNPWLNYDRHPQIMAMLLRGRTSSDFAIIKEMLSDADYKDELALFTFFRKSVIHSRINSSDSPLNEVYMPIIEFLSHHPMGSEHQNEYTDETKGYMTMAAVTAQEGSDECFANYGAIDCLDGYLRFGFISEMTRFARSAPLQINLSGLGAVVVNANNPFISLDKRADHLKDLGNFLPRIKYVVPKNAVRVSHLIIPGNGAPYSLKRVLHEIIAAFGKELPAAEMKSYIADAEQQVIRQNIEFYDEIASLLDFVPKSSSFRHGLNRVLTRQRAIIEHYVQNLI